MIKFKKDNIDVLFYRLLPAQIFVVLASSLSALINGLITGNALNETALCALGLVMPLTSFLASVATIVSGGAGILCGNYMGKGDTKQIDKVFSLSMIVLSVTGIILTAVCLIAARGLAVLCGAGADTIADTAAYIRGISIGIIPLLILPCLMTFLQMGNKAGVSLLLTVAMAVFNTVLCLIGIRSFSIGVFGVGLATSLSRYLALLLGMAYLSRNKEIVRFVRGSFDLSLLKQILTLGSPASLAGILYAIRNTFINTYAGRIGGISAVRCLAILASCGGFLDAFNSGVGSTLAMLGSVFIGEKDADGLKRLMRRGLISGLFLAGGKLLIVYLGGRQIAALFGAEGDILAQAGRLLVLYCWSAPFNIVTLVLMGIHQGLGRAVLCNVIYLFNALIVPFGCCTLLSRYLGIEGIYSCYYLAELVTIAIFFVYALVKRKAVPKNGLDLVCLDRSFRDPAKQSRTLKGMDDVINMSVWIGSFLEEQGIDKRRCLLASLCMEEMAGNIVEHGFVKDDKEHVIDAFVSVEDGQVLLRLRDDCVGFDPRSKAALLDPKDPCRNIGIRMVNKLASAVNYQSTFGLNVLTIRL